MIRNVARKINKRSRLRRTRSKPCRKIAHEPDQRAEDTGTNRVSVNRNATYKPSNNITQPATIIATSRRVAQASKPNPSSPNAAPINWARAARDNTGATGASSSSVIQATSAPLANVHDKPHNTCVANTNGNAVTNPVASIAVPISTCDSTSDQQPADRVGQYSGRYLADQREHTLDRADQDELRSGQTGIHDQIDAGDQPPAVVQGGAQPRPANEDLCHHPAVQQRPRTRGNRISTARRKSCRSDSMSCILMSREFAVRG